ncbi:MAG: hypothetical protein Q7S40_29250 [Opitutaceae bacterium]|nr:hypothetical protein [Opitutaceae bacterium]
MNLNRTRDAVLTLIGAAALLAYVLACTSFSPDDRKVLFPAFEAATGAVAVAVYDRDNGSTTKLMALPSDGNLFRAVWSDDGRRVIVLSGMKQLRLTVLPFKTTEPVRLLELPSDAEGFPNLIMSPAIVGSRLLLCVKTKLTSIDMETGAVKTNDVGSELLLLGHPRGVFYLRPVDPKTDGKEDEYEIGRVDASNLTCVPPFRVPSPASSNKFEPFFAVSPDTRRVALLANHDGQQSFYIFEDQKLARTIPAALPTDSLLVMHPRFSLDGRTLYATFIRKASNPAKEETAHQAGILEVPLDGAPSRQVPLFTVSDNSNLEAANGFQLDVSHDGKTLAVCSTFLKEALKPEDLALYFVDLTRADRKVTKIPIAAPPKPTAASVPAK